MAEQAANFTDRLRARFSDATVSVAEPRGEITLEVPSASWHAVALALRDEVDALMKGSLHTDELMGAVVRRDGGLRTGEQCGRDPAMQFALAR